MTKFYKAHGKDMTKFYEMVIAKLEAQLKLTGANEVGATACICTVRMEAGNPYIKSQQKNC